MKTLVTGFKGLVGGKLFEVYPKSVVLTLESDEIFMIGRTGEYIKIVPNIDNLKVLLVENGVNSVIHFGAITSTTERDERKFKRWNVDFSNNLLAACVELNIKFIFASTQAVYGQSWNVSENTLLKPPKNLYANSKYETEKYLKEVISTGKANQTLVALRLSNIFGPNEVHKGLMASTIFQFWNSAISSKPLNIYYALGKPKGSQSRDFISVDQVVQVIDLILSSRKPLIGIFNCGSGSRINFLELAKGIIDISNSRSMIEFVEMPKEIEKHYQWQTQANIGKLKSHLNWDIGGDLMSEIKRIYGKSLDESI